VSIIGDKPIAMSETPDLHEFQLKDMTTAGKLKFEDKLRPNVITPHPIILPDGRHVNVMTTYGPSCKHVVFQIRPETPLYREKVASVSLPAGAYMHCFGLTENYAVLLRSPSEMSLSKMVRNEVGYRVFGSECWSLEMYQWSEGKPSSFSLLALSDNTHTEYSCEAFFAYHVANTFEEDGIVYMDLMCYERLEYEQLTLAKLRATGKLFKDGRQDFSRFAFNLSTGEVDRQVLLNRQLEFPVFNEAYRFKRNIYVYGIDMHRQQVVKLNTQDGITQEWPEGSAPSDARWLSEPIFVAQPPVRQDSAVAEDEGVLLVVVLDGSRQTSFLAVLDAQTMMELARAWLPNLHHIPAHLHGRFYAKL